MKHSRSDRDLAIAGADKSDDAGTEAAESTLLVEEKLEKKDSEDGVDNVKKSCGSTPTVKSRPVGRPPKKAEGPAEGGRKNKLIKSSEGKPVKFTFKMRFIYRSAGN